jgi:hypothetical protein
MVAYRNEEDFDPAYDETPRLQEELHVEGKMKPNQLALKRFKPYIYVNHSLRIPTSITAAAFSGAHWRFLSIPLPVLDRSIDSQLGWVTWRMRTHCKEHGGKLALFGNITGYRWHRTADESLVFDCRGKSVAPKP